MNNPHRNPKRQLTLPQLLLVLLLIAAGFVYNYLRQGESGTPISSEPTPAPTAVTAPTDDQVGPPLDPTTAPTVETPHAGGPPAEFDFYVLALSWSPDYCTANGGSDPQQCSLGRKLGFVLHGLWPQYNKGYPSNCSTQKLPEEVKAQFPGLYPAEKLYDHEWEKHGTCSGLTPEQYLALSKKLKESVVIPAAYRTPEQPLRVTTGQFKQDFVAANAGLDESALAVYCSGSGRFLKELFVCFSTNGQPAACSAEIQNKAAKNCQNPDFLIRNIR